MASRVTCAKGYDWQQGSIELATSPWAEQMGESGASPDARRFRVVAYDYGIKQNILRLLVDHHCEVSVVPAETSAEDVLAMRPDGVFLSNGPGDPEPITYAIENIRKLAGRVPIFGICLGHQLCGLALGGKTFKLKFGHHGSNHPVKNLLTSQVEITAQNHGFCVDPESLPSSEVEITHVNLNDGTNEGMRSKKLPLFSVQYHPEASPGPHDSHYLFTQFNGLDGGVCEAGEFAFVAMGYQTFTPGHREMKKVLAAVAVALLASVLLAETPKLNIKTKHGLPMEEQRKEQMERLAKEYDLKKYTITRDIVIEKGAINHSSPVLTLNLRFLDNDDLALSAYVHEQGHWVLMERHRADNPALFGDLQRTFPNLDYRTPEGDGELRSSYFHIAVCMLEWQAMEAGGRGARAKSSRVEAEGSLQGI